MPVHTPGSGSDGMTVSSSPAILLQLPGETSFCYSFVCRLTSSCFHRWCVLVECAAREHGPHDPRILVGERDSRDIGMPPLPQLPKPEASGILLAGCFAEHSANAMDHQCAQIAIATFADTEQAGSPSTGSLFRHQAEPSRELTAVLEAGSIAHSSNQGGCRHRADAFDLSKPLALLAGAEDFPYLDGRSIGSLCAADKR